MEGSRTWKVKRKIGETCENWELAKGMTKWQLWSRKIECRSRETNWCLEANQIPSGWVTIMSGALEWGSTDACCLVPWGNCRTWPGSQFQYPWGLSPLVLLILFLDFSENSYFPSNSYYKWTSPPPHTPTLSHLSVSTQQREETDR